MLTRRSLLAGMAASTVVSAQNSPLKVGCQANAWPLEEGNFAQLLDALREMHEIGYRGFECNIRFVRGQFGTAGQARKAIEATGVQFIGAHMSIDQALTPGFAERAAGVAALGGERIVMSAKGLAPNGIFSHFEVQRKAAKMIETADTSKRNGVRIAYHNHNDEFANGNAEVDALARMIGPETMDFLVDAGHGYLGGGDPAAFLAKHPTRVFGFHIKTFKGKQQVPLGEGDFGFEKLAAAIRDAKWTGWLINEEGGGTKLGNQAAVRPDREYIRRVFGA
jgi:sugar phosphate isomerase/epimerase